MKLYSRPLSPYSAIVRGAAYLKSLPLKIIAPPEGVPIPEEFRAVTPLKRIPVLITGSGETILESAVIVEYFEERFPDPALLPPDPKDRALVRMFTRVADLDVLVPTNRLLQLQTAMQRDRSVIEQEFAMLHRGLRTIEDRMAVGPYALGAQVTLADAWLTPIRFMLNPLRLVSGRVDLLDGYPKLDVYRQNAVQQPALSRVWSEMTDGLKAALPELKMEEA